MTYKYDYSDAMERLGLSQELDTPTYSAFWLSNLEGTSRQGSCRIVFTPEGIILHGDLCPNDRGVVSDFGYAINWFAGKLSGDYLCSKFLSPKFLPELAAEEIQDWVEDYAGTFGEDASGEVLESLGDIVSSLKGGEWGQEKLYDALSNLEGQGSSYTDDGIPGYGYDPRSAALLIAIQARFAELYWSGLAK